MSCMWCFFFFRDGASKSSRAVDYIALAAATIPEIKQKREKARPSLRKGEMAADLIGWKIAGFESEAAIAKHSAAEVRVAWKCALDEEGLNTMERDELWEAHISARSK